MPTFDFAEEPYGSPGKVLIVDDEEIILKYLQKSLAKEDIEALAASNAFEGLDILETEDVDIVIADYRMPEMDGIEFLTLVREKYKNTSRILLSGYMDQSAVFESISNGLATTYFSKPWDDKVLVQRIKHILEIQKILKSKDMLGMLNSIEQLPTPTSQYQNFIEAVEAEKPINEISELLKKSPAIASKILQVANSAFYGSNETTSLDYAMMYVGLNSVKDILESLSQSNESLPQTQYLNNIFTHSIIMNRYIPVFYSLIPGVVKFKPFPAIGMTHDIGKIILLEYFPDRFHDVIEFQQKNPEKDFYQSELELGFENMTHADIGANFLDWWNMPDVIIENARYHHTPKLITGKLKYIVYTTHYTDKLTNYLWDKKNEEEIDLSNFQFANLSSKKIQRIASVIKEEIQNGHHHI